MTNPNIDSSQIGSALADAVERISPSVLHLTANERLASGVVWSAEERLIVTTSRLFHEQRDAAITIRSASGTTRRGTLVGLDESTELALVRADDLVDDRDGALVAATFGDGARTGLFVAPVARTTSGIRATFGLVSRVGPAWVTARGGTVDAYIDVDGSLPPGFSGGPLIDFGGRVLGINTRGLMPGGATIPSATVRRIVGLLAAGTDTVPGHLGVAIQAVDLPPHLRADSASVKGLLVTGVVAGSAAEKAGIVPGDILVAIDDQPLVDHAHLLAALAGKAGKTTRIRVARHGQAVDLTATPDRRAQHRHPDGHHHQGHQGWRGLWGRGCR